MAVKAYSTIGTTLKFGEGEAASATLTALCKIKSYPDLGGAPDTIETTDLEDESQTSVPGVQSVDALDFLANYTPEAYDSVIGSANKEGTYELSFGNAGAFTWTGQHTCYVSGGDVNGVREMHVIVVPSSKISKKA